MDNAQKAIMIGVGLFITIIIISAVLLIVNLGTGLVDDATSELGTMSTSLQNQILRSYDNKTLSGVQVRSAVQQYMRANDMTVILAGVVGADKKITATVGAIKIVNIKLATGGEFFEVTTDDYKGNENSDAVRTSMNEFNDVKYTAQGTYINTSSNYKSYVLKVKGTDTNVGVVFVPSSMKLDASQELKATVKSK